MRHGGDGQRGLRGPRPTKLPQQEHLRPAAHAGTVPEAADRGDPHAPRAT